MDYGLRLRGGVGETIPKVSYERTGSRYAGKFFFSLTFFILIVVLMLELVFGIIIETFKELRIDEQHAEHDLHFKCFICGVSKDDLEKDRIDFEEHNEKVHNMWNYVNYMIRLKFSDKHDLNAINSYTLENIEKKNINWIPRYTGSKGEQENSKEINDEEIDLEMDVIEENHKELNINKNRVN